MPTQQFSLYYKDGGSDKVYHAQIESQDDGYIVNFQYGKRNNNLTPGSKTAKPVPLAQAEKIFNSLKKEKEAKGYTEGESGAIFQSKSLDERVTGIYPQLPIAFKGEEADLEPFFTDDEWFMQEKIDGQHLITKKVGNKVTAINKLGLSILMPQSIEDQLNSMPEDCVLDGEILYERYYIYDVMEFGGVDLRSQSVEQRLEKLATLPISHLVIPTFRTEAEKRTAFADFLARSNNKNAQHCEGVVFKKRSAPYVPGKPASKGNHIKFRFFVSSTVHVIEHSKKARSVSVAVYDKDGTQMKIGKITIPPNWDIPEIGSFIEVRYAHCFTGGALYHTIYLGPRTDQTISSCTVDQIKFKPQEEE